VSQTAICSEEIDEKCWFCNAGYELNEGPEMMNQVTGRLDQTRYCTALPTTTPEPTTTTFAVDCFCENGNAAETGSCTPGNQLICDSCDDGYVLINLGLSSVCERRTTTTSTTTTTTPPPTTTTQALPLNVCLTIKEDPIPCGQSCGFTTWEFISQYGAAYEIEIDASIPEQTVCVTMTVNNPNDYVHYVRPRHSINNAWKIKYAKVTYPDGEFQFPQYCKLEETDRLDFWLGTRKEFCDSDCSRDCYSKIQEESVACLTGNACTLSCV